MIDELVLEQLLAEIAEEIAVPDDGAERVVHELSAFSGGARRPSPRATRLLMVAAAVAVVVGGIAVLANNNRERSARVSVARPIGNANGATATTLATFPRSVDGTPVTTPDGAPVTTVPGENGLKGLQGLHGDAGTVGPQGPVGGTGFPGVAGNQGLIGADGPVGVPGNLAPRGTRQSGAAGLGGRPADGAKVIKNGSMDLQVRRHGLRLALNRATAVAVGLGGYVANSRTSYRDRDPSALITLRVPSRNFEAATARLDHLPGVTVLAESANGLDVTAVFVDLQARLSALTVQRDSLLALLADAGNLGDILSLRDRVTGVQTQMDQLQGRMNLLDNQSAISSIAVTLSEKPVANAKATVHKAGPPATGMSKAWRDARDGFSNAVEWLLARSGGALIVLLAALALLFGVRYLYPVVRRGLL